MIQLKRVRNSLLNVSSLPPEVVLKGTRLGEDALGPALRNALQDRAVRDTIRQVHLTAGDSELLSFTIFPLTVTSEPDGVRPNRLESLILRDKSIDTSVDVSDVFAHYRFPTLQRLELVNCTISSWDLSRRGRRSSQP